MIRLANVDYTEGLGKELNSCLKHLDDQSDSLHTDLSHIASQIDGNDEYFEEVSELIVNLKEALREANDLLQELDHSPIELPDQPYIGSTKLLDVEHLLKGTLKLMLKKNKNKRIHTGDYMSQGFLSSEWKFEISESWNASRFDMDRVTHIKNGSLIYTHLTLTTPKGRFSYAEFFSDPKKPTEEECALFLLTTGQPYLNELEL